MNQFPPRVVVVVVARRKTHTPLVVIDSSQARQSMVSI
jgi:hypothetical protein